MSQSTLRSILFVLSALVPFSAYLLTLAPTVVFFDAGELITSSFLLSPGHPPGYPLYIALGKFASFLPFGSVAYKLNMMAAFFSGLSVMMVFLMTSRLLNGLAENDSVEEFRDLTAFLTALAFAFSYDLWNQAVIAEVYPMNTFIVGFIVYLLMIWRDRMLPSHDISSNDRRLLFLSAFLLGLGLGNHHTLLVAVPVIMLVVVLTKWRLLFDPKSIGISIAFLLMGLSIYLLLPLRAAQNPELNWGDPETLTQFRWVFFREGYPKPGLFRPMSLLWEQLKTFDIVYGFTGAGFALGCLGLIVYFKKRAFELLITVTIVLVLSIGIVIYGNPVPENIFLLESFHTPSYMLFSIWIGAGAYFILNRVCGLISADKSRTLVAASSVMAFSILPVSMFAYHYRWNDRSKDYVAYDYAQNELSSMPSNAILFTWGDSGAFPLWYLQMIERYQPGTLLVHTPHLSSKWFIDELPDTVKMGQLKWIRPDDLYAETAFYIMLRENYGKYPIYIDYSTRYSIPTQGFSTVPAGLIYKVVDNPMAPPEAAVWGSYSMRRIYLNDPYRDLDTGKAVSIYANTLFDLGLHLMRLNLIDEALPAFEEASKISPELKPQIREILFGVPGSGSIPQGHP